MKCVSREDEKRGYHFDVCIEFSYSNQEKKSSIHHTINELSLSRMSSTKESSAF